MVGKSAGNTTKRRPLYQVTAEALAKLLASMEPGSYLPSEPKLALQMGVSRATLREAMRPFEQRGVIARQQGIGTYVIRPPQVIESGLEALESIQTLAARIGLEIEVSDVVIEVRPATEQDLAKFTLTPGEEIAEVSRVLMADGRPIARLHDLLPRAYLLGVEGEINFPGSVLDMILSQPNHNLSHSSSEITAISADPEIARLLRIQRGDVLLCLKGHLFTEGGQLVDISTGYFLPGAFRLRVMRRVARPYWAS